MHANHSGWYAVELPRGCAQPGCRRDVRHEVFNRYNATMGKFCAGHAREKLRESDKAALDNLARGKKP